MDNVKTGKLIFDARQSKGLTQKQLADLLNVSDKAVSKWERGAGFPDVSMLIPLSDHLGLSLRELMSGEKSPVPVQDEPKELIGDVLELQMKKSRVKNKIAWAISICLIKYYDKTINYLKNNSKIDKWTYNKSLQKAIESYRITKDQKELLKNMKKY